MKYWQRKWQKFHNIEYSNTLLICIQPKQIDSIHYTTHPLLCTETYGKIISVITDHHILQPQKDYIIQTVVLCCTIHLDISSTISRAHFNRTEPWLQPNGHQWNNHDLATNTGWHSMKYALYSILHYEKWCWIKLSVAGVIMACRFILKCHQRIPFHRQTCSYKTGHKLNTYFTTNLFS